MEILRSLSSSSVAFAGYDHENMVLHVRFAGNDLEYEYGDVPLRKWKELQKWASKGQYINFYIKPFHKVISFH